MFLRYFSPYPPTALLCPLAPICALHDTAFLLFILGGWRVSMSGMALILNVCLLLLDMSCRSRLATLNEKLTALERRIEYIEARVSMPGTGRPHEAGVAVWERIHILTCCCKNWEAQTGLEKLSTLPELKPAFWDSEAVPFFYHSPAT